MGLDVLAVAVDVLGQDRHQAGRHGQQQRRVRAREPDDHRVGVGGLDRRDRLQHGLERMVGLDHPDREGDILRGQRVSVVEDGVLHEVKRHAQVVGGDDPGFRQVGLRVPLVVVAQRAREDLCRDHPGGDAGLHGAVEVARHLAGADHQRRIGVVGQSLRQAEDRGRQGRGEDREAGAEERAFGQAHRVRSPCGVCGGRNAASRRPASAGPASGSVAAMPTSSAASGAGSGSGDRLQRRPTI